MGNREIAELLNANDADLNDTSIADSTPLHLANKAGHEDIVDLF